MPERAARGEGLTAVAVAEWLKQHPDFLVQHPDLVRHLTPPSRFADQQSGAEVVDMQGFMLSRLQADLARAEDQSRTLAGNAHANLTSQHQVHEAALAILSARDLEELIEITTRHLPGVLEVDQVALCVEKGGPAPAVTDLVVLKPGTIDGLFRGSDVRLREEMPKRNPIFAKKPAIVSDALVRLHLTGSAPPALLALGSRDFGFFHPEQATELLEFFARVLEACLRRWLDLPPA